MMRQAPCTCVQSPSQQEKRAHWRYTQTSPLKGHSDVSFSKLFQYQLPGRPVWPDVMPLMWQTTERSQVTRTLCQVGIRQEFASNCVSQMHPSHCRRWWRLIPTGWRLCCLAHYWCRGLGEISQHETCDRLCYQLCHINIAKKILHKEEVLQSPHTGHQDDS
jgi:hypothetical protein